MSYYWAVPGANAAPTQYSAIGNQSSLQQERAYLLSALAAEESRGEQLTFSLEATRKRLVAAQQAEGSAENAVQLKKAAAGIGRRLKKSQRCQKAMISNLAAVTTRMNMLEQHQWRRAHHEYSQRMQYPSMNAMTQSMQHMTIQPPDMSAYAHQYQSPTTPHAQTFSPIMPMTPMPTTQWASSYANPFGSPLYTPFYCQPYEPEYASYHQQPEQNLGYHRPQLQQAWPVQSELGYLANTQEAPKQRAMSLPALEQPNWKTRRSSAVSEDEPISPKTIKEVGRRMSLMGCASAGLRLQKLVEVGEVRDGPEN